MPRLGSEPADRSRVHGALFAVGAVQLVPIVELLSGWWSPALGQPVRLGDALVEGLALGALTALCCLLPAGPRLVSPHVAPY